jgi:hyperosmotically inducible periplasmic protein
MTVESELFTESGRKVTFRAQNLPTTQDKKTLPTLRPSNSATPVDCFCGVGQWSSTCVVRYVMHLSNIPKIRLTLVALLASSVVTNLVAQSTDTKKPDNSAVNKGDQNPGAVTADQQKMNAPDGALAAKIRRSIMADKSLSTYAHNVKIIVRDGTVTLKGPVRSDSEVQSLISKATDIAGSPDKVMNQMSVAPTKH